MPALLDAADRGLLWLDADAYAQRLFANGAIDWLDAAAVIAWQRKTQGLLRSDVIALDAEPVISAWLLADPTRREAMRARGGSRFALKTLLADAGLRARMVALLNGLRASFETRLLALTMPGPARWLQLACGGANGAPPPTPDADDVEAAGMYVADFLRSFAETGVDALLLGAGEPVASADALTPVLNLCRHYRWDCGWRLSVAGSGDFDDPGFGYVVAATPLDGIRTGIEVPQRFWQDGHPPDGSFRYARVPVELQPERVLERLAALRAVG